MVCTQLELAKIAIRQDQPLRAITIYQQGLDKQRQDVSLMIGIARIRDMLNESKLAYQSYK